jgi:hypothetical protein
LLVPWSSLAQAFSRLVEFTGADHIVITDDTWRSIPAFQRPLAYNVAIAERGLIPGAVLSAFACVSVVHARMPLPHELAVAKSIAADVGSRGFQVLAQTRNGWEDLAGIPAQRHWLEAGIAGAEDVHASPRDVVKFIRELAYPGRALLLPYQTLARHHRFFGDRFALLDPADRFNDKNSVIALMEAMGLGRYVPAGFRLTGDTSLDFCAKAVSLIDQFDDEPGAYLKLSAKGMLGLANVAPKQFSAVYDRSQARSQRVQALLDLLAARQVNVRVGSGRVEERVPKAFDWLGSREVTVGGLLIGGELYLTYMGRMILDESDHFQGLIHSDDDSMIGLTGQDRAQIIAAATDLAGGLVAAGYRFGYAYFDMILSADGRSVVTDFNLRRGARSVAEAMLSHAGGSCYDLGIDLDPRAAGVELIPEIARRVALNGLTWYGSSSSHIRGGTVKLLIPASRLDWHGAIHSAARQEAYRTLYPRSGC